MPNGVSNSGCRIDKCSVLLFRPLKTALATQTWFDRCQNVTKLREVCYLVDQTKPTPHVCYVLGGRKVLNSVQVLWQRLHGRFVDTETSKVNRRLANWNLSGWRSIPAHLNMVRNSMVRHQCSCRVSL